MITKNTKKTMILSSGITFRNISPEAVAELKRQLTFDNPAYSRAMRYSRYNRVAISPYLMYYSNEGTDTIQVPIGTKPSFSISDFKVIDNRVYRKISVPEFVLELRESQRVAAIKYLDNCNNIYNINNIIQLPTGKGKSILGLYIAAKLACKTLIVVHKDDLVQGWQKDIKLAFDGKVSPGLIKAKSRVVGEFITLATVQTLNRLTHEELEQLYSTFGFVIQDEMHHCPANSYSVVANFRSKYRLGLTATPERSDGLDHIMSVYYGGICYSYTDDKDREEETDILPVKVVKRESNLYFNPVCQEFKSGGKLTYKIVDMDAPKDSHLSVNLMRISSIPYDRRPSINFQTVDDFVVSNPDYKKFVCEDIISEFIRGRNIVVFLTQKKHCREYYDFLANMGVSKSFMGLYYGDNSDNKSVLEKAEEAKSGFITITTYAKATEGTNVRAWEVEFLVSSINNEKNVEQAVGRIRRTKEGKLSTAVLYDYRVPNVYLLSNHGFTRDKRYRKLGFLQKARMLNFGT